MKRTLSYWWVFGLFVVVVVMGIATQQKTEPDDKLPHARFNDKTPLGGKGLHLLLDSQGYTTRLQSEPIKAIPKDAKVWLLLDPKARLSNEDAKVLLQWVKEGGLLIWSNLQTNKQDYEWWKLDTQKEDTDDLRKILKLSPTKVSPHFIDLDQSLLPVTEAVQISPRNYGAGMKNVFISPNTFSLNMPHDAIVGRDKVLRLATARYGKGRVIIAADALLFTNYGLAQGTNAVLVSNLIGKNVSKGAAIYFDERVAITAPGKVELPHTLLYYLWQIPLRWAWIQLLLAGILLWAFYGRRLGKPVPIPVQQPVTRASQFAVAMASLYQKARRPKVAADVLGSEFRRTIVRRTGASPMDSAAALAMRCSEMTGLPQDRIRKVLEQLEKPTRSDADVLRMALEMEEIERKLGVEH